MSLQFILMGLLIFLVIIIGAILLLGARAKAKLKASHPPPGQMVDIGGYRLHVYCQGEGELPVILDAGQGESGLSWAYIQTEVAKFTRVYTYDRAGLGWSDRSPKPRTAEAMVEELHALLLKAGIPKPYILVGASLGGLNARVYAHRYPDEVAGLVLVDAAHEDQYTPEPLQKAVRQMGKLMPLMTAVLILLVKTGIAALKPNLIPGGDNPSSKEAGEADKALRVSESRYLRSAAAEIKDVQSSHSQVRALKITSLGDTPLVVIRHGKAQVQMIPEVTEVMEETNIRLQAEVANQSSQGKLVVAEESGHAIQFEQPDVVIESIREVVELVNVRGKVIHNQSGRYSYDRHHPRGPHL